VPPFRDHIRAHARGGCAAGPSRRARSAIALVLAAALAPGCGRGRSARDTADAASSLAAIVATCAVVVGDVEVRRAGKEEWSAVTTGAVLRDGDAIRTGPGAFARVAFASGNAIELEEASSAVVDAAEAVAAAGGAPAGERVTLASGVAHGFFVERPQGSAPLRIRTPAGDVRLAAANGGDVRFRLTAAAAGTEIAITTGAARVAAGGGEVSVAAGRAVDVRAEGVSAPVELIAFPASLRPGVDERFALAPGLRVALAWEALPAAGGYRVQIARDLSFRAVVFSRDVTEPALVYAPPTAGMFAWRVAARDGTGRYGEYGYARRVYVDAAPPRDLLVVPVADAVLRARGDPGIRFAWSGERNARAYRLVIASTPALTERQIHSAATSSESLVVRGLPPGEYWWGVYEDDEPREPLFVVPRRLVVQAPSGRPSVPRAVSEWGR
jgi:hypothetical protein